jgi:anti-sigma regulatory factor (Ser/Thr protein kinase)
MGRQADIEVIPELSDPESGPEEIGLYASLELAPRPAAAAKARQLTRDRLTLWGMDALTSDAESIASELVANAVLHAVPPGTSGLSIIMAIYATAPGLRISVWDIGPGHPRIKQPDPGDTSGRGLLLIDALTAGNWGWWPTPASGGKVVHATLTADAQDAPA